MTSISLGRSGAVTALEKMKLARELMTSRAEVNALEAGPLAAMKRLKLTSRINQIRALLGAGAKPAEQSQANGARQIEAGEVDGGALVHATRRTWENWEAPVVSANHRPMSLMAWELFLIKTTGKGFDNGV